MIAPIIEKNAVIETLNGVKFRLSEAGVASFEAEAEILLMSALGIDSRIDLYISASGINSVQMLRLEDLIKKRCLGEPLQYLTGRTNFLGLPFWTEPGVFIPRPETEILVENVILRSPKGDEESLFYAKGEILRPATRLSAKPREAEGSRGKPRAFGGGAQNDINILDLCTGSGNIAICLAKYKKSGKIIASDISDKAIKAARKNTIANSVEDKIAFIRADLFEGLNPQERFDIIVSNPPYIRRPDLENLPKETSYEPQEALDGGPDGLDFYRRIIEAAPYFLKDNGILAMEIGDGQSGQVRKILDLKGSYTGISLIKDLNGLDRVFLAWIR